MSGVQTEESQVRRNLPSMHTLRETTIYLHLTSAQIHLEDRDPTGSSSGTENQYHQCHKYATVLARASLPRHGSRS